MTASHRIGAQALRELIPDLGSQPGPRYRALSVAIASLLADGRLSSDTRLPSERELAGALGLSRATTTAAYDTLAAQRMLMRQTGSGSVLVLPPNTRVAGPSSRARASAADGMIDLSIASLPAPPGVIEAATAEAARSVGQYATIDGYQPYGLPEFRAAVAERYCARGLPTSAEQVLITNGAQHGFDIVLRAAIDPGDRVLTEVPTYPGALEAIKAHRARVVAVPLAAATGGGTTGWDVTGIRNSLMQTSPRLAFLIPDFQNPTGVLVPTEQREAVATAARRAGTRLVIDESFIDLDLRDDRERLHRPAPVAGLDPSVISLGSLSKPVWGGLRVGWVRADADTVQRLAVVRARGDMGGAVIEQLIAHRLLDDLTAVAERRCAELRAQRDTLLSALSVRLPRWRTSPPAGGLSTWIELDSASATPLTYALQRRGVLLNPGSRFTPDGTLERFLRLPFALPSPLISRAVDLIADTWSDLDVHPAPAPRDPAMLTT